MPHQHANDLVSAALPADADATRFRAWGTVTQLEEGKRYRINRIEIEPGHHISTQMHYHRSEHWVVVSGTAKVICNQEEKVLIQKQSTYVPMGTPHRVENPGVIPLVMIEIQNGEYLGEDDIIRFEKDPSAKVTEKAETVRAH
ncbi:phosphomannose isomerase type II C-terminal cupin domain [Myxacorys almedinensis]|uniref:Cupin domain-containing protein n=1 Tax=Myxacorys almedinensis A TaxID=2690445 RepID=A0A8J7Z4G4_9CYAN|nr:phosphomannose isomerase type II C-terminal cupin domain [Myxacorys almedinensis]NDJ19599.1 cupin domain-containing protein [Myxacorys almedinensis A]